MSIDRAASQEIASLSLLVEPIPESSRQARRFVSGVLADDRFDAIREIAVLLTSELVTNALLHSASPAEVSVAVGDEVTVLVRDADTGPLLMRTPSGELDEGGRGMLLVDRLADRWGTEHSRGQKTIWFSLRLTSPNRSPDGPQSPEKSSDESPTDAEVPPAVAADRRLALLVLDRDLEAHLSQRQQVVEILGRTVAALDANGAYLDLDAALGEPVTSGSLEGQSKRERLEVGGESYGHLTVFSDRHFSPEEDAFVRLAAERLALSLANTRLLDAAHRRHADIEMLAEATELLAGSTSVPHVLSLSVQIAVPDLAEWAVAYIVDERGQPHRVTAIHTDESRLDEVVAFLDADEEVSRALGAAHQHPDVARLQAAFSVGGHPYQVVFVPLQTRRQVSGLIILGCSETHDPSDHLAIVELGRRVGLALDNATLHERVIEAAHALQASLIPAELPDLPRLQLAANYHAVTPTVSVGGDFYDVFELPDKSVILAVGDVCGKGPAAAAMARTCRDVLRLLLDDGWPIVPALRRLNGALGIHSHEERFCTIAVARYTPGDQRGLLTVCLAGHPQPILLRKSGTAEAVGEAGGILGVLPDRSLELKEVELALDVDDSLVLYTDGVTEARRGRELFGMDRLASLLTGLTGASPQQIADSVHDAAARFSANSLRDDVAVLVAKSLPSRKSRNEL